MKVSISSLLYNRILSFSITNIWEQINDLLKGCAVQGRMFIIIHGSYVVDIIRNLWRMLLWIGCYSSGHRVYLWIQNIWNKTRREAVSHQMNVLSQGESSVGRSEGYPAQPPQGAESFVRAMHLWRQSRLPADICLTPHLFLLSPPPLGK